MENELQIPLFPLPNVVHFPFTDLRLHVFEPRYRQLVRDLQGCAEESRWIGMVLLKPGAAARRSQPPIFPAGTAGRLIEVEPLEDGRSNILLHGQFRFHVEEELGGEPYRQATVRRIDEPAIEESDPSVVAVRQELIDTCSALLKELGSGFPLSAEAVQRIEQRPKLEPMVNTLAADLDLPVLRKLQLLADPLPERALSVLSVLRSRRKVLDLLRPYRHLAAGAELN